MNIKKIVKKIEKKAQELADLATLIAGSTWFIVFHIIWFGSWVVFKIEPFPYGLLTMLVSLESILLSGLILSAADRETERDRQVINRDLRISKETQKLLEHMHEELLDIKSYVTGIGEESEL